MGATTVKVELDAVFKALASSHRREILRILSESDAEAGKTCCAAEEVCACKIPTASDCRPRRRRTTCRCCVTPGLVTARKDGLVDVLHAAARCALSEPLQASSKRSSTIHGRPVESASFRP